MRAAYITELGPPDRIRVGDLPVPEPGPTDVLVAVRVVTVDPVDALIRSGRYRTLTPFPFIVGRDLAGIVAGSGRGAPFRPGEQVWCNSLGHDGRQGSFAEYAVVPAERLYRLPEGCDPDLAVAVAHPAATAYLAWFVHAGLRSGETVYVGGAAGNVGFAAVQLAHAAGARIVASARPADHERCREAGADAVADYRDPGLADRLRTAAPGGFDVFWDTSGHHDLELAAGLLAPGGRVLLTAGVAARPVLPVGQLYTRDITLLGFVISRAPASDLALAASHINRMLASGRLTARITGELTLDQTAEAHRRIEAGEVGGRLLIRPAQAGVT
jgi:NADPH:quinone reductase-like Zn-dependent oxidoreductase